MLRQCLLLYLFRYMWPMCGSTLWWGPYCKAMLDWPGFSNIYGISKSREPSLMCTIWSSMHYHVGCMAVIGCRFAVGLVGNWHFDVMGSVPAVRQYPFVMLFPCYPCAMSVMLGGLTGLCRGPRPLSVPDCLYHTALPLLHCLLALGVPQATRLIRSSGPSQ